MKGWVKRTCMQRCQQATAQPQSGRRPAAFRVHCFPLLLIALHSTLAPCAPTVTGANRKAVKRRGQELAYRLRHMARSKHRGGQHPNLSEQLAAAEAGWDDSSAAVQRQRRGKRRQSRSAALEQLTRAAALPVADATRLPNLDAVLGGELHSVVAAEEAAQAAAEREAAAARSSIAQGGSLYDTPAALAYATSRMPACYAALSRVLGEVADRRPGWRPASMLDFGSGPGTAVWAAQQVWRQSPLDALAIEPAGAMSWLGHEIQQAAAARYSEAMAAAAARSTGSDVEAASGAAGGSSGAEGAAAASRVLQAAGLEGQGSDGKEAIAGQQQDVEQEEEEVAEKEEAEELPAPPPRLRWMYKLPPQYRGAKGKRYDLVTAGYVLGELRSDAERRWGWAGCRFGGSGAAWLGGRGRRQGSRDMLLLWMLGILHLSVLTQPAVAKKCPCRTLFSILFISPSSPPSRLPWPQAPGAAAVGAHVGSASAG